jgi:hypothetical protein
VNIIIPEHCEQCYFYSEELEGVCFLYHRYLLIDDKRTTNDKMYYKKCKICARKEVNQIELEYEQ